MRVLVVEDNEILNRNLVRFLSNKDIFAESCFDWEEALRKARLKYYDAIILDIWLPWIDWLEVCKILREESLEAAIIMLTALSSSEDIITGLEVWSDDYLVKPFDYLELLARLKSATRRNLKNKSNTIIRSWELEMDLSEHSVSFKWKEVKLSKLEFDLLKYLLQNKWVALSREEIYKVVWGEFDTDFMFSKTIDVYVWYLRKKLSKDLITTKTWYWFMIK